ncbi:WXG100 family type VII secretion target [Kineosporia babensis]|uniref:PPE domain-containing protein n=1 Tax=Kineosporia babensis TaxID=499548 RepID=A0A9X1SSV1_9ACTN|nr:hypothetical protein [Kineosporia babensis]MCD5310000.1 hypothetical protein [Kineosporia babensis]
MASQDSEFKPDGQSGYYSDEAGSPDVLGQCTNWSGYTIEMMMQTVLRLHDGTYRDAANDWSKIADDLTNLQQRLRAAGDTMRDGWDPTVNKAAANFLEQVEAGTWSHGDWSAQARTNSTHLNDMAEQVVSTKQAMIDNYDQFLVVYEDAQLQMTKASQMHSGDGFFAEAGRFFTDYDARMAKAKQEADGIRELYTQKAAALMTTLGGSFLVNGFNLGEGRVYQGPTTVSGRSGPVAPAPSGAGLANLPAGAAPRNTGGVGNGVPRSVPTGTPRNPLPTDPRGRPIPKATDKTPATKNLGAPVDPTKSLTTPPAANPAAGPAVGPTGTPRNVGDLLSNGPGANGVNALAADPSGAPIPLAGTPRQLPNAVPAAAVPARTPASSLGTPAAFNPAGPGAGTGLIRPGGTPAVPPGGLGSGTPARNSPRNSLLGRMNPNGPGAGAPPGGSPRGVGPGMPGNRGLGAGGPRGPGGRGGSPGMPGAPGNRAGAPGSRGNALGAPGSRGGGPGGPGGPGSRGTGPGGRGGVGTPGNRGGGPGSGGRGISTKGRGNGFGRGGSGPGGGGAPRTNRRTTNDEDEQYETKNYRGESEEYLGDLPQAPQKLSGHLSSSPTSAQGLAGALAGRFRRKQRAPETDLSGRRARIEAAAEAEAELLFVPTERRPDLTGRNSVPEGGYSALGIDELLRGGQSAAEISAPEQQRRVTDEQHPQGEYWQVEVPDKIVAEPEPESTDRRGRVLGPAS